MKTADLTGAALDWAVCKSAGLIDAYPKHVGTGKKFLKEWKADIQPWLRPSTNWAQSGPIIEREGIELHQLADAVAVELHPTYKPGDRWECNVWPADEDLISICGPTPLIAAMRCYVASKLGDEVDVPEELL
ncbi:MAG: DUF2591 domain-containing protein [Proteobacteria bacterium]|nr:DUF2591 domain-containing protein [Pseudomonadota bacterium]